MNEHENSFMQLPKYKCHKEVWALKIEKVELDGDIVYLIPEDKHYDKIELPKEYFSRHNPVAPGYFVLYVDGYKSWSPVEAFELGYTEI